MKSKIVKRQQIKPDPSINLKIENPETQEFISALKAENFKLQKQIAKLQAQNVTLSNRITILEDQPKKNEISPGLREMINKVINKSTE